MEELTTPIKKQQSAAARALVIPEILSAALLPLQSESYQHLFACTLVNKSWNCAANKLLWENCGVSDSTPAAPSILSLVSIPLERRQSYANVVRRLTLNQPFEAVESQEYFDQLQEELRSGNSRRREEIEETYLSSVYWTGIHIPQLNEVSFPRLEILDIEGPSSEDEKLGFLMQSLLGFAQPTLKKLYVHTGEIECQMISEEFFIQLEQNCKGLVEFSCPSEATCVSLDRLRSSMLSLPSIEKVFESWSEIMSDSTFQAIGRLPRLKEIILDCIEDGWVGALKSSNTGSTLPFKSLTGIFCSISSYGFEEMSPYFKNLQDLILMESEAAIPNLWEAVARCKFPLLNTLKLYLHQDTMIQSTELLELLDHITALQTLRISGGNIFDESPPVLRIEPFDDKVVEAMSKRIPAIKELQLHCTSTHTVLSEHSLLSLGTNCPELEDLYMIANIDWTSFVVLAPGGLLSRLSTIQIEDYHRNWVDHIEEKHRILARAILVCMPSLNPLRSLSISGDQAVETAFLEVLWASKNQQELAKLAELS